MKFSVFCEKLYLRIRGKLGNFLIPIAKIRNNFLSKDSEHLIIIYDLQSNALSFNFLQFLIDAEIYREKLSLNFSHLYIINKHRSEKTRWDTFYKAYSKSNLEKRANYLLPQLANLFPKIIKVKVLSEANQIKEPIFSIPTFPPTFFKALPISNNHDLVLSYLQSNTSLPEGIIEFNLSKKIEPLLRKWLKNKNASGFVVITIRNSKFDISRNSKIKVIDKFADYLKSLNIEVLPIPDSENPSKNIKHEIPSELIKMALENIHARFYLYKRSMLNIFSPNGPSMLCTYSLDIPYILMDLYPDKSEVKQREIWFDPSPFIENCVKPYWSRSNKQFMVKEKETFLSLKKHFENYRKPF